MTYVDIDEHQNSIAIEPSANSVFVESVDVETIVHFLATWQPVHVNREVTDT